MPKPNIRLILTGLVVLVGLLGIARAAHLGPRLRIGNQTTGILTGATRVETFRVMSQGELENPHNHITVSPTAQKIDGYSVIATGKEQGPPFARKITDILFDEGTYTNEALGCTMVPGVVFRVWRGSQSLDVILCFHCGELQTVIHDVDGKTTGGIYTVMAGNSRSEFARLAKDAFPNDPDIQAL